MSAASARDGASVLLPELGMAVPVALDDETAVLVIRDPLPGVTAFTAEHLRLLEALAAHAAVALTNSRLLDRMLASIGLERERYCYITNILHFRTPGNRPPATTASAVATKYPRPRRGTPPGTGRAW